MTLAFVAGGVAFTACESESEEANNDEYYAAYASITSSDSNFTSTSKGGTINFKAGGGEVRIYVSCGTDWLVENSNSKAFTTYITDTDYLIVSAGQNLAEAEVAGTITLTTANRRVAFASITVIQNAYGAPEISVDTNEWNAPAVGRLTTSIGVSSTDEWAVECGAEWLTVEKSGTGLNLTAAENEDTEERTTEIVLTCTDGYNSDSATVTVIQDGLAYITLSEEALEFDAEGGKAVITVESNFDWKHTCYNSWISVEKNEEDGSATITCSFSEVEDGREGTVTFSAGDGASNVASVELPIVQGAYLMPRLTVETEDWHAPAVGELTTEIGVESTYEWTFETGANWLTGEKTETGIRLTAAQNSETAERTAEVVLTCADDYNSDSAKIKVTQDGAAYITISDEELAFSVLESSTIVSVESNYDWDYTCDSDWLTVAKASTGISLRITCPINYDTSDRGAVLTITAGDGAENVTEKELKIVQEGCNPEKALILEYDFSENTNQTVKLPLESVTYAIINWGDGESEVVFSDYPSHKYSSGGIYTVTVNGEVGHIHAYVDYKLVSGADCLTAVVKWGDLGLTDMEYGFTQCSNLKSLPDGPGPFSNVTSFYWCFYNCKKLENVPEEIFQNCTAVTTFNCAFYSTKLTSAPSFKGCVSVTDFGAVFDYCTSLTTVPEDIFSGCTAVTDFGEAFWYCYSLTSVPKNIFSDCTSVTNFSYTFANCTKLEGESPYSEINVDGETVKVHLYERYKYSEYFAFVTNPTSCFSGCTGLTDYSSISVLWK